MVATLFQKKNSRTFQEFPGHFLPFSRTCSIKIPGYSRTKWYLFQNFKDFQGPFPSFTNPHAFPPSHSQTNRSTHNRNFLVSLKENRKLAMRNVGWSRRTQGSFNNYTIENYPPFALGIPPPFISDQFPQFYRFLVQGKQGKRPFFFKWDFQD